MKTFLTFIIIVGFFLILGLITFEDPQWDLFGINIPFFLTGLIALIRIVYRLGRIGIMPYRFFDKHKAHKDQMAMDAFSHAFYSLLQQNYNQVPDAIAKALRHPKYAHLAYTMLAHSYLQMEKFDKAQQATEQARERSACPFSLDLILAESLLGKGEQEQAKALLQRLLLEHPKHLRVMQLCKRCKVETSIEDNGNEFAQPLNNQLL